MNDLIINDSFFEYYHQRIAVITKTNFFSEIRKKYVEFFLKAGFIAEEFSSFDELNPFHPTCCVVISPVLFDIPTDSSIIWVGVQTEQIFSPELGGEIQGKFRSRQLQDYLTAYDIIVDFQESTANELKKIFRKTVIVSQTNCKKITFEKKINPKVYKKYDILFLGTRGNGKLSRRRRILDYLSEKYIVYPESQNLWGEERDEVIRNSKICLNLHYDESLGCESNRFLYYFKNGAFVLSERMLDSYPYVEDEDYATFYLTNICERIDYYLNHETERNRIAQNAYSKYLALDMDNNYKQILDAIIIEAKKRQVANETKIEQEEIEKQRRLARRGIKNKVKLFYHCVNRNAYDILKNIGLKAFADHLRHN